jgi:hypothetical protein
VHEIMESFAPKRKDAVVKALQYLLDEGLVQEQEGDLVGLNG